MLSMGPVQGRSYSSNNLGYIKEQHCFGYAVRKTPRNYLD